MVSEESVGVLNARPPEFRPLPDLPLPGEGTQGVAATVGL